MPTLTSESREAIAAILEQIAEEGLPGPRDIDVALDAIESSIDFELGEANPKTYIGEDEHFDTKKVTEIYGSQ